MKHLVLDDHSEECKRYQKSGLERMEKNKLEGTFDWIPHLLCQTDSFIFYHVNNFYLIEYHKCLCYDHLSFKYSLLQQAVEQIKKAELYSVYRSHKIDEQLKKERINGIKFKREINEYNYTYCDNAGREYCFYTSMGFKDHLINSLEIEENAKEAIEYLKEHEFEYLINDVDRLKNLNRVYISDHEIHKTIESLVKQINKK